LTLPVPEDAPMDNLAWWHREFTQMYRRTYAHNPPSTKPMEVESLRVIASAMNRPFDQSSARPPTHGLDPQNTTGKAWFGARWIDAAVHRPDDLVGSTSVAGPCLIVDRRTTTVVEPGWSATIDRAGAIILKRDQQTPPAQRRQRPGAAVAEVFAHRVTSMAEH